MPALLLLTQTQPIREKRSQVCPRVLQLHPEVPKIYPQGVCMFETFGCSSPRQSPQAVTHHFLSSPFLREARLPALQPAGPTQPTDTKKTLVDVLKRRAGRCNLNIENTATKNINRSYLRLSKTDFFFPPFRLRSPKHAAASTTLVLVH